MATTSLTNIFSKQEVFELLNHFKDLPVDHFYEKAQTKNKNLNYHIQDSIAWKIIKPKISKILNDDTHNFLAGAYKEYTIPFQLHIDNIFPTAKMIFEHEKKHFKAFLIPLMDGPNLKTAIFDVHCQPGHPFTAGYSVEDQYVALKEFCQDTPTELDMNEFDHIHEPLRELLPYVPVDGIVPWHIGDVIMWDIDQLHCSTNFKKHNIVKKFIVVMIN